MKNCDIIFCRRNTLLSKIIRYLTKSKYSHVGILLRIAEREFVFEAQAGGTQLILFEDWCKKYQYDFDIIRSTKPINERDISIKALSKLGNDNGYDFEGLLIRQPLLLINNKWKLKDNKENFYCSELIAYCLSIKDYTNLSPGDLFILLINDAYKIVKSNY